MLKLKLQYFGHLIRRADSLEKTLMLGKTEGRRRGWQRMRWLDGVTNLMDMSLSKLRSRWWTGKPGVLQSMGSQTSWTWLNWTDTWWNKCTKTWEARKWRVRVSVYSKGLWKCSYLSVVLISPPVPDWGEAGVSDRAYPLGQNQRSHLWTGCYGSSCMMLRVPHTPS